MAKKVVQPSKPLTIEGMRAKVLLWREIDAEILEATQRRDAVKAELLANIGIHESHTFGLDRVSVLQNMTRTIPWKELCYEMVKKFYSAKDGRLWFRRLVRKFPKKPGKPYIKLFALKEKAEVADKLLAKRKAAKEAA